MVAPEVCLSGYDYDNFEKMVAFSGYATEKLKEVCEERIVILTMLERDAEGVFNFAKVFYKGEVVYTQAKAKLFKFGNEHNYMKAGREEDIGIVEVGGIKIGILICFELRFKKLWQKLEGADLIAIPAWWGRERSENFKILTQALAIMNQCYLVASDSKNGECTAQSGIITPFGITQRNKDRPLLEMPYDPKEIKKMRRYMVVGIDG